MKRRIAGSGVFIVAIWTVFAVLGPPGYSQVMNDRTAATANTAWLTRTMASHKVVRLPERGTLYVEGTATTPATNGCGRFITNAAFGYPMNGHSTMTGLQLRIVQIGKGPILRLAGVGFMATDPIEWVGDGESAIIEVEGRTAIATGWHRFVNQTFFNAGCGLRTLAGYYDGGGNFVREENHADNCYIERCFFEDVGAVFRNENNQAVNWRFRDCNFAKWKRENEIVFADLLRGGHVLADGCLISCPKFCVFRLHDVPANVHRLAFERFERDRFPPESFPGNYLQLVDYQGDRSQAKNYPWEIIISGAINTHHAPLDRGKFFSVPPDLPRTHWRIDIPDLAAKQAQ